MNTSLAVPVSTGLASTFTLSRASPCRDAVSNGVVLASDDLNGATRPVGAAADMGCYEISAAAPGGLVASFALPSREILAGRDATLTATLEGDDTAIGTLVWRVASGAAATNYATTSASLTLPAPAAGWYDVTLFATNASYVGAPSAADAFVVRPATCHVSNAGSDTWPYDTEAKAARSLRDAVTAVYGATDFTGTVRLAAGTYASMACDTTVGYSRLAAVSRPVRLVGADDPADVVLSYTVTGAVDYGGGILLNHPGASLCGVTLTGTARSINDRWENGMALHLAEGSVSNCVVRGAVPVGTHIRPPVRIVGGLMTHCSVRDNYSSGLWGRGASGVYLSGGEIRRCDISGNRIPFAYGDYMFAGGVYQTGGIVRDCAITNNYAARRSTSNPVAGGARLDGGLMERCVIAGNINDSIDGVKNSAGGLIVNGAAIVRNCLVSGNTVMNPSFETSAGLMLTASAAAGAITNVTVAGNIDLVESAPRAAYVAAGRLCSTILWGTGAASDVTRAGGTITYPCFASATTGDGSGNLASDPAFKHAGAGDYRLLAASPCVDAGCNAGWTAADLDLAGVARLFGQTVDIGAYENTATRGTVLLLR